MSHSSKSFFPIQPSARVHNDGTQIDNEIVGGVTKREMFALEIFAALASNAALTSSGVTLDQLRMSAVAQAGRLLDILDAGPERP